MAYLGMVDAPLVIEDLDALDPATLKAMFLVQQSELEIYAREGVELDRSTLAKWVGGASACSNRWSKPCAVT